MLSLGGDLDSLSEAITGRTAPIFTDAILNLESRLVERYSGSRILITGGAGFIATQTLKQALPFVPAKVVVADTSENSLAELVRDLRTSGLVQGGTALEPRLVDVTGPMVDRLVAEEGPFDAVLAFAAAKHVRSERDPISVLQMLNVNIIGTIRAVRAVLEARSDASVFVVSTDKAADPASIMGASKRVMELAVLGTVPQATTTRFANVAFSSGSLLQSWLIRLSRGQVLPVPADTRRFFVSPRESGQLCAIASVAPPGSIVVPRPEEVGSVDLLDALFNLLARLDLHPITFELPAYEAARAAGDPSAAPGAGSWPVLVTARDTAGEKAAEVFVGAAESAVPWEAGVDLVKSPIDCAPALGIADWVTETFQDPLPGLDLGMIVEALSTAIPNLEHVSGSARLDDRV